MDQEEIEREIKYLKEASKAFLKYIKNEVDVDRLETLTMMANRKEKNSQDAILENHEKQINRLIQAYEMMANALEKQTAINIALHKIVSDNDIDVSHLRVVR